MDVVTIAEQGGQGRTLTLTGPALPVAGSLRVSSSTMLRTEHYGRASVQQVDGFTDDPIDADGLWCDVQLAAGEWATFDGEDLSTGDAIREALEDLQRAGEVLRMQAGSIVRYGRFERIEFTPYSWGELGWSWSFVPFARSSVQPTIATAPRPEDAPSAFAAAMEAALDGVEWFEDLTASGATAVQDVLARYVDGPLAVLNAGGRALQTAARGIDAALVDVLGAATDYVDSASTYKGAVQRIGGIAGTAGAQARALVSAVEDLCGCDLAGTDEPAAQLTAMTEVTAAILAGAAIEGQAARLAWQSRETQEGTDGEYIAHTMRDGEDLRDVAWRYWQAPERWTEIAAFNGLTESLVAVGREVVIPPSGRKAA